ncbi:hypothetical protein OAK17_06695 [Alphaproteobacteria bacterium]|nr:hypothetical protein [Alphaproteobacteria bacterium]
MKTQSILQLNRGKQKFIVITFITAMVFLSTLSICGGLMIDSYTSELSNSLKGSLTVQLPGTPNNDQNLLNKRTNIVIKELNKNKKISKIEVLNKDDSKELLKPWIGKGALPKDITIPIIIDITISKKHTLKAIELEKQLSKSIKDISVIDNENFSKKQLRIASLFKILVTIIVLVVSITSVSIIVLTTSSGIVSRESTIELLHLIGAKNTYIASDFLFNAFLNTLFGAIIGVFLSIIVIVLCVLMYSETLSIFVTNSDIYKNLLLVFLAKPLIIAIIASITAYLTVLKSLKKFL